MSMQAFDYTKSKWSIAAEAWLTQALSAIRGSLDAISEVDAALACLRIEAGELPPDESLLDVEVAP